MPGVGMVRQLGDIVTRGKAELSLCASLLVIAAIASPVHAQEVNSVQPAGVELLEDSNACVALAEEVGDELLGAARKTANGITFGGGPNVYRGDAGVALHFIGLYRATRGEKWLEATRATLAEAVAAKTKTNGLYTGRAGVGEACVEAYLATGKREFLEMARTCSEDVGDYAATDVISGAAGGVIFLLNLHKATGDDKDLALARRVGDYLVATAVREDGAAHWQLVPGKKPKVYLGFSHGAAGIGYALLHLWRRTGDAKYRELAEEAAEYVLANEDRAGDERAHWWRTVPKSSESRRIQWCHGAPGIGLFFQAMQSHLKERRYAAALQRCLATTKLRGREARRSGCQCHGVAGNAELFLEVYAAKKDVNWLHEARRSGSALLAATLDGYRVRTGYGNTEYTSSYMVGLAGIGHFFLRLADPVSTRLPMMVRP